MKCVQSLHKSIRIDVGVIILGANTLYISFCLFKQIPMASNGLNHLLHQFLLILADPHGVQRVLIKPPSPQKF